MILLKDLDFTIDNDVVLELAIDRGEDYDFKTFLHWYEITPMYRRLEVIGIYPTKHNEFRVLLNGRIKPVEEAENGPKIDFTAPKTAENVLQDFKEWLQGEIKAQEKAMEKCTEEGQELLAEYHYGKKTEAEFCLTRLYNGE